MRTAGVACHPLPPPFLPKVGLDSNIYAYSIYVGLFVLKSPGCNNYLGAFTQNRNVKHPLPRPSGHLWKRKQWHNAQPGNQAVRGVSFKIHLGLPSTGQGTGHVSCLVFTVLHGPQHGGGCPSYAGGFQGSACHSHSCNPHSTHDQSTCNWQLTCCLHSHMSYANSTNTAAVGIKNSFSLSQGTCDFKHPGLSAALAIAPLPGDLLLLHTSGPLAT